MTTTQDLFQDARDAGLGVDEGRFEPPAAGTITLGDVRDADTIRVYNDADGKFDHADRHNASGALVETYGSMKAARTALGID